MNPRLHLLALLVVLATCTPAVPVLGDTDTSVLDLIPMVSQMKCIVQALAGEREAANRTATNYLRYGIGPAQASSVYSLLTGRPAEAWEIQKEFASKLESVVDGLPVMGHVIGLWHLIEGDAQHGWDAIKAATSNTGTAAGALVGGGVGALAGRVVSDAAISAIESMVTGDARPYGTLEYARNFGHADAGEHFDAIVGGALDATGGASAHKAIKASLRRDRPVGVAETPLLAESEADRLGALGHGSPLAVSNDNFKGDSPPAAVLAESEDNLDEAGGHGGPSAVSDDNIKGGSPPAAVLAINDGIPSDPATVSVLKPADSSIPKRFSGTLMHLLNDPNALKYARLPKNRGRPSSIPIPILKPRQQAEAGLYTDSRMEGSQSNYWELEAYLKARRHFLRNTMVPEDTSNFIRDGGELFNYRHDSFLAKLDMDALKRSMPYLDDSVKSLITSNEMRTTYLYDSLDHNSLIGSLAGILKMEVEELRNKIFSKSTIDYDNFIGEQPIYVLRKFKDAGYIDFSVSPTFYYVSDLYAYLIQKVKSLSEKNLILTQFERDLQLSHSINSMVLKYKVVNNRLVKLLVDYRVPGLVSKEMANPIRFNLNLDNINYICYIIYEIHDLLHN